MLFYYGFVAGVIFQFILVSVMGIIKRPIRWQCPICQFKMSTNNQEVLARVKLMHKHELIQEEPDAVR